MNRKLLTPVQYESVLGGVNKARPLSLVDEGRVILSSPVLNSIAVDDDRPVQGKFLRGSNGAALVSDPDIYDGYQFRSENLLPSENRLKIYTFDPPAEGILLRIVDYKTPCRCEWKNRLNNIQLVRYFAAGCYWVPFTGVEMFWRFERGAAGDMNIELYAFYGKDI